MPKLKRVMGKSKEAPSISQLSRGEAHQHYVPYALGFKPSTEAARLRAIGFEKDKLPKEFDPGQDNAIFFKPIPPPLSDADWLAQYNEDGQSYKLFLRECPWISGRKVKFTSQPFVPEESTIGQRYPHGKVYIVQVGDIGDEQCAVPLSDLVDYAGRFLGLPVATLPAIQVVEHNHKLFWSDDGSHLASGHRRSSRTKLDPMVVRYHQKNQWLQVSVDSFLKRLRAKLPQDALCLIGLTMYDLYGDDPDLFVAGMAAGLGRVAVFSLRRYDPNLSFSEEFWYDVQQTNRVDTMTRQRQLLQRSCKLVVHEIGHLLGLDHCVYFDCCMNGSGHLEEDFRQSMHLCPVDLHKLHTLVGFDVLQRYKNLHEFYDKHHLVEERDWIDKRIAFIE